MSRRPPTHILGDHTKQLLLERGLTAETIAEVEAGSIDWDIITLGDGSQLDLLLLNPEGGVCPVATLTAKQADDLIDAFEFDRRTAVTSDRPPTFPEGHYEDWAGIGPDSDWSTFIEAYRKAADALKSTVRRCSAAYLFVCRHTLELQLKALIMLGQQAMELTEDLPGHHDLDLLWTAAFPIAKLTKGADEEKLTLVRRVIEDFHNADPQSFHFRYPVSKRNKKLEMPDYVQSFSVENHAAKFHDACEVLQIVIRELHLRVLLKGFDRQWAAVMKKRDK